MAKTFWRIEKWQFRIERAISVIVVGADLPFRTLKQFEGPRRAVMATRGHRSAKAAMLSTPYAVHAKDLL